MTEYRFGRPGDWLKIIDFIDLVFSQAARPHDFAALIPKVYGEGHDFSHLHAIALEDGEIRGCVAVLSFEMSVAGQRLRVGYVGSVSVHRLSRGAGHMKRLMQMQLDRAKADGLDVLALGGQRQRYGYFGFQPVGGVYRYTVTPANVRHALQGVDASPIAFAPLTCGEASRYAHALYERQPVCGSRPAESFAEIARTFNMQGWLITHGGRNAGYLIASGDDAEIAELAMEDAAHLPAVFKAWIDNRAHRGATFAAAPHDKPLNRALAALAEGYGLGQDGYGLMLDHANAVRAWMTLKSRVSPLSDGALTLDIEGKALSIRVQGGAVSVEQTDAPASVRLTAADACQLFFGFNRFYAPEIPGLPADWFPLPWNIPMADTF